MTIDALGCQTEIAQTIIDQGAGYVIVAFETLPPGVRLPYARTTDKGHRRIELRECWVTDDPAILSHIQVYKAWAGLQSF